MTTSTAPSITVSEVTANDHLRCANLHREAAIAMFRNRWKRISGLVPHVGIWRRIDRALDRNGYLGLMHYTCATARGHAQLARELITPLRPVSFKRPA